MAERAQILIVDDDRQIRQALSIRLNASNFDVITAQDGPLGIDLARTAQPDIILLDIRMPGMDGLDVLEALKADPLTSEIPVIALSANVIEPTRSQVLNLGGSCFVEKPYQIDKLKMVIHSILGMSQPQGVV